MAELELYKVFASPFSRGKELAERGVEKADRIIGTLKRQKTAKAMNRMLHNTLVTPG